MVLVSEQVKDNPRGPYCAAALAGITRDRRPRLSAEAPESHAAARVAVRLAETGAAANKWGPDRSCVRAESAMQAESCGEPSKAYSRCLVVG